MKIFITGITGFIGRHLCEYWSSNSNVQLFGCARGLAKPEALPDAVEYFSLDMVDREALLLLMQDVQPDIIIHAAALSRPNDCEVDHNLCRIINVTATENIIEAANTLRARLLFLSSDMVFGNNGPYNEDDETCPVNFYGETKAEAERLVIQSSIDYAIIRTVLVYGKKLPGLKNSFLQWVDENIQQTNSIRVFTDQFRTATYVNDLCAGIDLIAHSNEQGIFHVCGESVYTPYEMAVEVTKFHGKDDNLIQPITSADMQEAAVRPSNCTLSIEKVKRIFGYKTTPLKSALAEIFS